jgi:predicted secreted protein
LKIWRTWYKLSGALAFNRMMIFQTQKTFYALPAKHHWLPISYLENGQSISPDRENWHTAYQDDTDIERQADEYRIIYVNLEDIVMFRFKIVFSLVIILFLCLLQFCEGETKNTPTALSRYENFKKGYHQLNNNQVYFKINDCFYVERKTEAVPYVWEYRIDNSNVVYVDDGSFDIEDSKISGGSILYLWRFRCVKNGTSILTFSYRTVARSKTVRKTDTYTIIID